MPSAIAAMTLASWLLTGCGTASSEHRASLQVYQPRVLSLKAGLTVETASGRYTPQTDEIWHSHAAYSELEHQLINTAAALSIERNRNTTSR